MCPTSWEWINYHNQWRSEYRLNGGIHLLSATTITIASLTTTLTSDAYIGLGVDNTTY